MGDASGRDGGGGEAQTGAGGEAAGGVEDPKEGEEEGGKTKESTTVGCPDPNHHCPPNY